MRPTRAQQLPLDARCALHPTVRAQSICPRCGSFACAHCTGASGQGLCGACRELVPPLATRGDRFLAAILDSLVMMVPIGVVGVVAAVAIPATTGGAEGEDPPMALVVVLALVALAVVGGVLAAQLLAQLRWGQSIGKRLMNIKVVRSNGDDVELWRLLLVRNLAVQVLSQACGIVGIVDVLMIFGQEQRCLHDLMADTIVVQFRRSP